jgi:hypothetical protein
MKSTEVFLPTTKDNIRANLGLLRRMKKMVVIFKFILARREKFDTIIRVLGFKCVAFRILGVKCKFHATSSVELLVRGREIFAT